MRQHAVMARQRTTIKTMTWQHLDLCARRQTQITNATASCLRNQCPPNKKEGNNRPGNVNERDGCTCVSQSTFATRALLKEEPLATTTIAPTWLPENNNEKNVHTSGWNVQRMEATHRNHEKITKFQPRVSRINFLARCQRHGPNLSADKTRPGDRKEARQTLRRLSFRAHQPLRWWKT